MEVVLSVVMFKDLCVGRGLLYTSMTCVTDLVLYYSATGPGCNVYSIQDLTNCGQEITSWLSRHNINTQVQNDYITSTSGRHDLNILTSLHDPAVS